MITKYSVESEDKEDIKHHINGPDYFAALREITDRVFRPARKHGYHGDIRIIMNEINSGATTEGYSSEGSAEELISELESLFCDILQENNIKLN